jgi:ATP-dependent Lhr-like helicase
VKAVGQIGAPWSVNSLIQRLGRSGRRDGEASEMRLFVEEFELREDADLVDRFYPELLQAIALIDLMLERWLEPPDLNAMDFSTFIQQVLSVLAETGGATAADIYERLIAKGAFSFVGATELKELLQNLGSKAVIEQMPEGDLILGIEGERIVKSMEFYSAFASTKEYAVLHVGKAIGSLPAMDPPPPKDHLLLAGRRWMVVDVDTQRSEIHVVPAHGKKAARFHGVGGEIHDKVRRTMRDVLLGTKPITYLNVCAQNWLLQARNLAQFSGLVKNSWHSPSAVQTLLFTWSGTRIHRTIGLMIRLAQLDYADKEIAFEIRAPIETTWQKLEQVVNAGITDIELASVLSFKERRKYDHYVPDQLLTESFAHDALDVERGIRRLRDILSEVPMDDHS